MLELLRIQNYALIDNLEVEFKPGLNALTGETGAGKSIIIGALNLVLGARASNETVRDGADRARIEAVFRLSKLSRRLKALLDEFDVPIENGELMVARTVTSDGKSRAHAGGTLLPLNALAQLGDELVDLHGQHDHQSLLIPERQLDLLDGFAGADAAVSALAGMVSNLRSLEKSIAELESDDRERARRIEFLKFEVSEINAANLQPGEEEEVRSRRNLITNAEQIYTTAARAYQALYESDGDAAIDKIDVSLSAVSELNAIDSRFAALAESLGALRANAQDISAELRGFTEAVEYDPQELDDLNRRLSQIADLKRKFGDSIDAILAYRDNAIAEIERFDSRDQQLASMRREHAKRLESANEQAEAISLKRRAAAMKLDKKITGALQELGMKGGTLETRFEQTALTKSGIDRAEFLLSANPGERPKPLRQVASGGEISRVMLAIKTVLAGADRIPTLIFDEIDAGVGGAVANKVAQRLRDLSATHQTICITHLPQIAAAASAHFTVEKGTAKGRTLTRVQFLEPTERTKEVARLLDGSLTDVSLKHAEELLRANR
ncbi:MAG: DNA repair protein RecN [Candidatus Hydrogenedentes bacterium]|nr:DNA repair protein RecN [Candidatus Hydrogenedentota bacterium]